jgi:predicted dehydrogenase
MNSEKIMRAAVIGLGNIGFQFNLDPKRKGTWSHITAYERCNRTELVGAVEIDKEKVDLFQKNHKNIPVYTTIQELMQKSVPEIVSICTPTESHYTITEELLRYPVKGIFCEKSIALTIADANKIVNMCSKKKVVLAINHTRRWDDNYLYAKKVIEDGLIGPISAVNAFYSGQIFNIGTHLFDTLRMLINKETLAVSGVSFNTTKSDPDISGWIKFSEEILCAILTTGKREDLIFEIDIVGSKGRIRILNNGETIRRYAFTESPIYSGYRELSIVPSEPLQKKDRFVEAVYDIVEAIEGRKEKVNCSGYDGLAAVSLSLSMLESAQNSGNPVKIVV